MPTPRVNPDRTLTGAEKQRRVRERHSAYVEQLERVRDAAQELVDARKGDRDHVHNWIALVHALENTQGTP